MQIADRIHRMSCIADYRTISFSAENKTGAKGAGGMAEDGLMADMAKNLGKGWKVSPGILLKAGESAELARMNAGGAVTHIWLTGYDIVFRQHIIRFFWDDCPVPSIECPLGDFFAAADPDDLPPYASLLSCLNPKNALVSYWEMPFKKGCRITLENMSGKDSKVFYQITCIERPVAAYEGYLHAQFRRDNPVRNGIYTVLDTVRGKGQYVGTYFFMTVNCDDWWGEGEFKFYLDGDRDYPSICGTGLEDYFCGSDGYTRDGVNYMGYATPCTGFMPMPVRCFFPKKQFSMYRWHVTDPVCFRNELRLTVQDLGWKSPDRTQGYKILENDISSTAFWYQNDPAGSREPLPAAKDLLI